MMELNNCIIELNGKNKVWRAVVSLSDEAIYDLEQNGFIVNKIDEVYDEEEFDLMIESES